MDSPLRVVLTVEQCWQPVPGGSGTYITELATALADRDDVDVVGLSARHGLHERPVVPVPVRALSSRLPRTVLYEAWGRTRRPRVEGVVPGADVVHATTWAVPGRRLPLVVTVHDLAFLRDPSHFTRRGNAWFRRALEVVRDEAAAVVVPSRATRDDCLAEGIGADRIHVVPHGVRALAVSPADVDTWRRTHGIARPYVLWCGTLEPRKNLGTLVDACSQAAAEGLDLDLVLVGPAGWGGVSESLAARLDAMPGGRVHRLGRLSDRDLHAAYAGAHVFAFPSLWEGFGMPVLEAMAHGVPVVTSAGTSMAEFVGEGGVVVDPSDAGALAAGLVRVAGEDRDRFASAARSIASGQSWAANGAAHRAVYAAVTRH